jgi:hypothetical protein
MEADLLTRQATPSLAPAQGALIAERAENRVPRPSR